MAITVQLFLKIFECQVLNRGRHQFTTTLNPTANILKRNHRKNLNKAIILTFTQLSNKQNIYLWMKCIRNYYRLWLI